MALLIRDDLMQFVVQPYRELLTYKTASLLKKEIRLLAHQNGTFVRLYKQLDGRYEAVFSRDPGYLLAESIWYHFDKPKDLIYCEELADKVNALVVIVRAGEVLFDAKLPIATLGEELSALLTLKHKFNIYVYGNIPLTQHGEKDKIIFDADHVLSFTHLEEPVYPNLQLNGKLQLIPVEQAITEHRLGRFSQTAFLLVSALVFVFAYFIWSSLQPPPIVKQAEQDPYLAYKSALITPSPKDIIDQIKNAVMVSYNMPGWIVTNISFARSGETFQVHSYFGDIEQLMDWAKNKDYQVNLNSTGAELYIPNNAKNRSTPTGITHLQNAAAILIDRLLPLLPGHSVQINSVNRQGAFSTMTITVNFNRISPDVLQLLGDAIKGLPVRFDDGTATVQTGLLTGSIQLTVLGN